MENTRAMKMKAPRGRPIYLQSFVVFAKTGQVLAVPAGMIVVPAFYQHFANVGLPSGDSPCPPPRWK